MAASLLISCASVAAFVWFAGPVPSASTLGRERLSRSIHALLGRAGSSALASLLLGRTGQACANQLAAMQKNGPEELLPNEAKGLVLAALPACCALGAVIALSPVGAIAGAGAFYAALAMRASAAKRERETRIAKEMPTVFRSLATALASGFTLQQALSYVASHGTGPSAEPFSKASLMLRCGDSIQQALEGLERGLDAPGAEMLTSALLISQKTGSPLGALFSRSAELVESQIALAQELSTKTAQARLSVRIVCAMPAIMVALLALLSPEYREGLVSATGLSCLALAVVMDVLAVLIIRHLMGGVEL